MLLLPCRYKIVSKSEDARLCLYRGKENFSMLFKAEGQWLRQAIEMLVTIE